MAMTRQGWSISGLAVELGRDRRFISKLVEDLEPIGRKGKADLYAMSDVFASAQGRNGDLDATQEKARRDKEAADKLEMENAKTRGELISGSEIGELIKDHILRARAKLMVLGSRLAPQLAAEMEVTACQRIVEGGVDEALGELAGLTVEECGGGSE